MILKPVFIIAIVAVAMIGVMVPSVFADHSEVTITPISGSGSGSGCELTEEGCYNPSIATVDVGGVVIFSNTDSVSHVFSSGTPSDDDVGTEFNSGLLAPGDSAEWKPENVGKFPYFDMVNPWMVGEIIVTSVLPDDIQNDSPIASFVDQTKDPQHYIDRYNNEPTYKEWFDENYPQYSSIYEAVGLEEPEFGICGEGTKLNDGVCTIIQKTIQKPWWQFW